MLQEKEATLVAWTPPPNPLSEGSETVPDSSAKPGLTNSWLHPAVLLHTVHHAHVVASGLAPNGSKECGHRRKREREKEKEDKASVSAGAISARVPVETGALLGHEECASWGERGCQGSAWRSEQ